jgi:hypothetical protein
MQPEHRSEVLTAAKANGWSVDSERTTHGAMSDAFTKEGLSLILFWVETPWCDARSAGGFLTDPDGQRQVYRFIGSDGVMAILKR